MPTNELFAPDSPIMRTGSFHRGENCADVAIPLIASGGCRAVSAGVLGPPLLVTPAAVLKWFGSTAALWEQIAEAVGRRWLRWLALSSRLASADDPCRFHADLEVRDALGLFLPLDLDEVEWTRVWLSLLEHGRHHQLVGEAMSRWEAQELELLHRVTDCRDVPTLTTTLVVVRGLRQMTTATHEPLSLDVAQAILDQHVHVTYVANGVPEPASDADVLPSSLMYSYFPARPSSRPTPC